MPVFKKKRVTTQASARRVADESKANWVSKFVDKPSFSIDLGIWAPDADDDQERSVNRRGGRVALKR
jgi:hypothetical protein